MPDQNSTFFFEKYELDLASKRARFFYSYDSDLEFIEELELPLPDDFKSTDLIDRLLFNVHLAIGISYWKAYVPKEIQIKTGELSKEQALFWNTVYTKGLGEFFYTNQLDFRGLVHFPFLDNVDHTPVALDTNDTSLVLLGGGKDSLVTVELMQAMKQPFDTYSLNQYDIISQQADKLTGQHYVVKRYIDKKLLELNEAGAYNGHVPISMVYTFTALLLAAIKKHSYVIASNERSANSGNVEYQGEEINHQWSKSFEFEQMFQQYVESYITSDIKYFSLLRPLSEFHIAKLFSQYPQWHELFTSCNRNFTMAGHDGKRWCGQCAKDAFVFTILSSWLPQSDLVKIFGKNIYADRALLDLFKQLLGKKDHKPFDCVGTVEEMTVALELAQQPGEYQGDLIMKYFTDEILPTFHNLEGTKEALLKPSADHAIPEQFQTYLHELSTD